MANILNENFDLLKVLFTECLQAKNNPKDSRIDLEEKIKSGSLLFVLIKKVNRLVKYKVRSGREELQAQKTLVDANRLHLQNLLYEVNYLKREIKQCYKFKSQDEDIDIYEPPGSKALTADSNLTHKERISRLERELNLRKQLSNDCKNLLNDKTKVFHEIINKMENLSTFAPSLKTLLKATRPLQEALQLPIEQKWTLENKVHMLQQNLYMTYVNLRAIEMLEGGIKVTVNGQEDEVKEYEAKMKLKSSEELEQSFLLKPHPLSLQIKLSHEECSEDFVMVDIYYLPLLMIATAHCEIRLSENNSNLIETNLLQDFLKFINEDDLGENLPYSETSLNLQKHNIKLEDFKQNLCKHNLGLPYQWLQKMIGNSTFNNTKCNDMQTQKLKDYTLECVKRIRNYFQIRHQLITQIRAFMNKNIDEYIGGGDKINQLKPNCALVQWSAVSWEEYESAPTTQPFVVQKIVDEYCGFFRAVIVLGSAKMECLISLSNKYPLNIPLWSITVHWNGHHTALNNSAIKVMEHYTNSIKDCKQANLLASQLLRTMYSFDIFLETEGPLYQPLEYTKEKSFIKSFSKRIRMRPFKCIKKGSVNYFKQ
ncbi:THO complex subunit 5 [Musca vetustissima]|uniref:THO complex subunit 5 n=1 Tax=Musca vetustissima TaxID=27455 RepID=UPI002AB7652A|nr:THO complex subunit 5 [Musca vetustissima]